MKSLVLSLLLGVTSMAAEPARITPLITKQLRELPGKEAVLITVRYGPGTVETSHQHKAHTFVYVLEGTVIMQVEGGKERVLTPGDVFYEGPEDRHVVGRNASPSKPAKFLVFFVKDSGAPVVTPVP